MRSFKDNAGRDWIIEVNYSAKQRVQALAGIDLFDLSVFEKIGADPVKLIDILAAVCQPRIEELKLTREVFCNAIAGDAIESAADALMQEIIDFFPRRRRETLNKVLATARQVDAKAMDLIAAKMDSGELLKKLEASLNPPSGAAPESAASTPAPSASVSST